MCKHDWLTGLLCQLESYSRSNGLNELAIAISGSINVALDEIESLETNSNVILLSEYRDRKTLEDAKGIINAFSTKLNDLI